MFILILFFLNLVSFCAASGSFICFGHRVIRCLPWVHLQNAISTRERKKSEYRERINQLRLSTHYLFVQIATLCANKMNGFKMTIALFFIHIHTKKRMYKCAFVAERFLEEVTLKWTKITFYMDKKNRKWWWKFSSLLSISCAHFFFFSYSPRVYLFNTFLLNAPEISLVWKEDTSHFVQA